MLSLILEDGGCDGGGVVGEGAAVEEAIS